MNSAARETTLSVVVTAHAEGRLLRPTLRSVMAALAEATEAGVACELIIVLDNATPATAAEAGRWREPLGAPAPVLVSVGLVYVSHGDPGASRNAGATAANGKYVAFCDGDDLVSSNYFLHGVRMLEGSEEPIIVHPSVVLSFGARSAIWHIRATEKVDHLGLIRDNLWPSASMSLRSTYIEIPYQSPDPGFGPEDWLWNIETAIARIPHRPVPRTMFFYRVRDTGGVNNRHLHSILPAYDLDALVDALPIRARSVTKKVRAPRFVIGPVRRFLARSYLTSRPAIRIAFKYFPQSTKERMYAWAIGVYRGRATIVPAKRRKMSTAVAGHLRHAAEIEPAISWTANGYLEVPIWVSHDDGYSERLIELVTDLRAGSRAIVAVPWVGIGGADLVSLNYARALANTPRFSGNVTMLATFTPSRTLPDLIPDDVRFVQLSQAARAMSPDRQRKLMAEALILTAPELVVSVNCFDMTNSLQLYGQQLSSRMRIYLTLFAFDRIGAGYPVNPITDDSQREYLDLVDGILTDNTATAQLISTLLALESPKVQVHYQPALNRVPALRDDTRAHSDAVFSKRAPFRILWPHRLDKEKRPDALIKIADLLRERGIPATIFIHGQQVLSSNGESLMKSLDRAGVVYRGPYSGGLTKLPTHDYHALLLTSESEGLPLVLVQSMLLGLPVIATAVGGVTDIVRDNDTGLLVAGPDDAEGFVRAIAQLMESLEDRQRIIRTAYEFAAAQHGWEHFTSLIDDLTAD